MAHFNSNENADIMGDCGVEEVEEINSWDDLDLDVNILRGIYAYGFEKPSPIQRKAIKPVIDGRDIIAQAQSGTGKTATFTIGALSHVDTTKNTTQVLVLSPTRELSKQTANVMNSIGSMLSGLKVQILVGGSFIENDISDLKTTVPHIIAGCPGRVYDMMRRNIIVSTNIKLFILDEADEMLSSEFKEQVYNIFQYLKKDVQIALFSATLPDSIQGTIMKIMKNPVRVIVKSEQLTLEGISQFFVAIEDDKQKYGTLKDLYNLISISQCIIYCNSVKRVADLYDAMLGDGFPVCCIHSGMEKQERDDAFSSFKTGKCRVLISSNVTSRGIDIQQVSIVINFDLPKCIHNYLHRIGRSGRWGRKGVGINLITRRDIAKMREIEQHYACQINELPANFDSLTK
jgi:translation initiation factor 4A